MSEILFIFLLNGETMFATIAKNYDEAIKRWNSKESLSKPNFDSYFTTTNIFSEQWKDYKMNKIPKVEP